MYPGVAHITKIYFHTAIPRFDKLPRASRILLSSEDIILIMRASAVESEYLEHTEVGVVMGHRKRAKGTF